MSTVVASQATSRSVIRLVSKTLSSLGGLTVHYNPESEDAREGRFAQSEGLGLHGDVLAHLTRNYPAGVFTHQHQAIASLLAGNNTVVATRTSSGKSLVYSLPVLDALCRDCSATALFLYPQKALANDQLVKLQGTAAEIAPLRRLVGAKPRLISRYDGSTPGDERPEIRSNAGRNNFPLPPNVPRSGYRT